MTQKRRKKKFPIFKLLFCPIKIKNVHQPNTFNEKQTNMNLEWNIEEIIFQIVSFLHPHETIPLNRVSKQWKL
jgi:hypothetical protein